MPPNFPLALPLHMPLAMDSQCHQNTTLAPCNSRERPEQEWAAQLPAQPQLESTALLRLHGAAAWPAGCRGF